MDNKEILTKVNEIWGLSSLGDTIHSMWKGGKLHSFSAVGVSREREVFVDLEQWVRMRNLGDRMHVPTSVYVDVLGKIHYASWKVTSGIGYAAVPLPEGGAVAIPQDEFKVVESKAKSPDQSQ